MLAGLLESRHAPVDFVARTILRLFEFFRSCILPQVSDSLVARLPILLARRNEMDMSTAEPAVNPALSGPARIGGLA